MSQKPKVKTEPRPAIEAGRQYSRREAAYALGVGQITLYRAYDNGHLQAYRIGGRILHSGQHLIDWLEGGGRTGRTAEDVKREASNRAECLAATA